MQSTKVNLYKFGACVNSMHNLCDIERPATGTKCSCICHQKAKLHSGAPDRTKHGVPMTQQLTLFRRINFRSGGVCLQCGQTTRNFGDHILKCAELGAAG